MNMQAITLYQPWASLIAVGVKDKETRGRRPPSYLLGERLAIHAAKRPPRIQELPGDISWEWTQGLPRGVVVAAVTLICAHQVRSIGSGSLHQPYGLFGPSKGCNHTSVKIDKYGDFSVGRWVWFLDYVVPLDPPEPAVGRQGIWYWERG